MLYHVGIGLNAESVEEGRKADTIESFANALVLECVFGEEINDLPSKCLELVKVGIALELHERHDHCAHKVADLQRTLAANQNRHTLVVAGRERLVHDIDAMHAADAALVVDVKRIVVVE